MILFTKGVRNSEETFIQSRNWNIKFKEALSRKCESVIHQAPRIRVSLLIRVLLFTSYILLGFWINTCCSPYVFFQKSYLHEHRVRTANNHVAANIFTWRPKEGLTNSQPKIWVKILIQSTRLCHDVPFSIDVDQTAKWSGHLMWLDEIPNLLHVVSVLSCE